ncbi:delta-60 repeat domain-containing protein [Nocardia terpenica]|uniref:delta-60 repeat domain-containing protein n=1 Tax=Nocardia terpenica TaxID=455432 RepID=UPI002FDF420E
MVAVLAMASCSSSHSTSTGAGAGTLDPGFGSGGKVTTDLGSRDDRARAVAVQQDGKIVAVGTTQDPGQGDNFAVVRYETDGKVDTTFGDGGRAATDFGGKADIANAVALQQDGKIVAAGTSHGTDTGDNIALARYTADGKLDTGFGDGGKVSTDLGTKADHANAVAVEPDGKIVVAGSTHDPAQGDNFVVVRYTSDGKLDPAFGENGKVSTDFGGKADAANALVLQPDGKVVAAGTSHGTDTGDNIALARYTADGKLDTGFGNGGKVSTDLGTKADHANAVVLESDGKIVVAGSTQDPGQGDNFVLVRYTADGKQDAAFGEKGKVSTDFGGKADIAHGLALAPGGALVVAGTSSGTATGDNVAVARYTADGKLDTGFGSGGTVSTDLGTKADHGDAVAVQPDGKILVAGSTADPVQGDEFLLLRYQG